MAQFIGSADAINRLEIQIFGTERQLQEAKARYESYKAQISPRTDQTLLDMGLAVSSQEKYLEDLRRQLQRLKEPIKTPDQTPQTGGGYPLPPSQPQTGGGYTLPPKPGPVRKIPRYIVRMSSAWARAQTAAGKNPEDEIKKLIPPGANYTIQGI